MLQQKGKDHLETLQASRTDDIGIMTSIPAKHLPVLKEELTRAHVENTEFEADKIHLHWMQNFLGKQTRRQQSFNHIINEIFIRQNTNQNIA